MYVVSSISLFIYFGFFFVIRDAINEFTLTSVLNGEVKPCMCVNCVENSLISPKIRRFFGKEISFFLCSLQC